MISELVLRNNIVGFNVFIDGNNIQKGNVLNG